MKTPASCRYSYPCGAVELVVGQVGDAVVGRFVQVPDVRPQRVVVARLGLLTDLSVNKGAIYSSSPFLYHLALKAFDNSERDP